MASLKSPDTAIPGTGRREFEASRAACWSRPLVVSSGDKLSSSHWVALSLALLLSQGWEDWFLISKIPTDSGEVKEGLLEEATVTES